MSLSDGPSKCSEDAQRRASGGNPESKSPFTSTTQPSAALQAANQTIASRSGIFARTHEQSQILGLSTWSPSETQDLASPPYPPETSPSSSPELQSVSPRSRHRRSAPLSQPSSQATRYQSQLEDANASLARTPSPPPLPRKPPKPGQSLRFSLPDFHSDTRESVGSGDLKRPNSRRSRWSLPYDSDVRYRDTSWYSTSRHGTYDAANMEKISKKADAKESETSSGGESEGRRARPRKGRAADRTNDELGDPQVDVGEDEVDSDDDDEDDDDNDDEDEEEETREEDDENESEDEKEKARRRQNALKRANATMKDLYPNM